MEHGELTNKSGLPLTPAKGELFDASRVSTISVHSYSSQYSTNAGKWQDGPATNTIDGDPQTHWHSHYTSNAVLPQWIVYDLGSEKTIDQVSLLNRQRLDYATTHDNALVQSFTIESSSDGTNFTKVMDGVLPASQMWQHVAIPAATGRYFKVQINTTYSATTFASLGEVAFYEKQDGITRCGDKRDLQDLVDSVDALKATTTPESWKTIETELANAKAGLFKDVISDPEMHVLYDKLIEKRRALVSTETIDDFLAPYLPVKPNRYTPESWEPFSAARSAAIEARETCAQRADFDQLLMKTKIAYLALEETGEPVPSVDKSHLITVYEALKTAAGNADAFGLDDAQKNDLQALLGQGKTMIDDETEDSQASVDAMTARLHQALLNLRYRPDADRLSALSMTE